MLRVNRRSVVQQPIAAQWIGGHLGAQVIGGAGGIGDPIFRLTEEERLQLQSFEEDMNEIEKEAIEFSKEVVDTIKDTKNSIGLVVASFVGGDRAFQSYMPSPEMGWTFWSFIMMWSLIASMMTMANLAIVRHKFGSLNCRRFNMMLRSTRFHHTLEANASREVLDNGVIMRLAALREQSFSRPGKQILLHLIIVVICIMGITGSGTLIDSYYEIVLVSCS